MLFISRRVSSTRYGVVDTDDDSEEFVEFSELNTACCELGIEILGVDVYRADTCGIADIMPYQLPEKQSLAQLKMAMLFHVDIIVYKDVVVGIRWRQGEITSPVDIRVSDFGSSCAEYVLIDAEFCNEHVVTIILDDKVDFSAKSFQVYKPFFAGIEGAGAVFDLRAVSSDEKAYSIYRGIYACPKGVDPFNSIIDKPERMEKMREFYRLRG